LSSTSARLVLTPAAPGRGAAVPPPYPIRIYDPTDEGAILDLLKLTVGETAGSRKTAEFWRWKHAANPFGPSYSVCAWDDAVPEIAGLRTLMWWSFRDRSGSHLRAARAVDTATHPAHQRRGIFSALTQYAIDDLRDRQVPFIFNTPNGNSLPGYLKMGWRVVGRWPLYMRPSRWLKTGWRFLARRLSGASAPDSALPVATNLMGWARFRGQHDADLARLVFSNEILRRCVGYRTERTLAYLDWRYGGHPDIEYGVHVVTDDRGLAGVLIGRPVRGIAGLKALAITEMLMRTPSRRAGAKLLRSVARATDCDYLMAHFAPGTLEHDALSVAGFVRAIGRGYTFVACPLNTTPDDPTQPGSWDLTLGELEIF
jgi:GNAT superfamily N-acetyltransferase